MGFRPPFKFTLLAVGACLVAGCDPFIHLAWENDFQVGVDIACIEKALRSVAPDVRRTSYQSDGGGPRGFARGITVTQFNYSDLSFQGGYTLDVAIQPDGSTRYWHEWGKVGTKIPPDEREMVEPLLNRVNKTIGQSCSLSFPAGGPQIGAG